MKVLIVHPPVPIYGGAERVIVKLCEYMRGKGIGHGLFMPSLPKGMAEDLGDTRVLSLLEASQKHWDVINYHNFPATLSYFNFWGVPSAWLCNEPPELFTNWKRKPIEWLNRKLVKNKIKNVIVADKFNARRFFDLYDVVPKIIPYGVDYDFFNEVIHSRSDQFTVMQVGTISHFKNQLASIKALAYLKDYVSDARLILVGNVSEPDYKNEVEGAITEYQLGGHVIWEPHVTRRQLQTLYAMTDVLIHPCNEQGGWLTPFEALSARVPVVVSGKLSCSDLISSNNMGMVVDNNESYGPVLHDIYKLQDYHREKTQIAKAWVKDNLSWEKYGKSMVDYFKEVANGEARVYSGDCRVLR
jgi:glycosyltransferase involved in cell wall biosynthesis